MVHKRSVKQRFDAAIQPPVPAILTIPMMDDSFHVAIWPSTSHHLDLQRPCDNYNLFCATFDFTVLAVAQIFGMMPVSGLRSNDGNKLRVYWRSARVLWSLLCVGSGSVLLMLSMLWIYKAGMDTKNLGGLKHAINTNEQNVNHSIILQKIVFITL